MNCLSILAVQCDVWDFFWPVLCIRVCKNISLCPSWLITVSVVN